MTSRLLAIALLFSVAACAPSSGVSLQASAARQVVHTPPMADSVMVTYLANGGWLIESGEKRCSPACS